MTYCVVVFVMHAILSAQCCDTSCCSIYYACHFKLIVKSKVMVRLLPYVHVICTNKICNEIDTQKMKQYCTNAIHELIITLLFAVHYIIIPFYYLNWYYLKLEWMVVIVVCFQNITDSWIIQYCVFYCFCQEKFSFMKYEFILLS